MRRVQAWINATFYGHNPLYKKSTTGFQTREILAAPAPDMRKDTPERGAIRLKYKGFSHF